jgi:hypothetical protein
MAENKEQLQLQYAFFKNVFFPPFFFTCYLPRGLKSIPNSN